MAFFFIMALLLINCPDIILAFCFVCCLTLLLISNMLNSLVGRGTFLFVMSLALILILCLICGLVFSYILGVALGLVRRFLVRRSRGVNVARGCSAKRVEVLGFRWLLLSRCTGEN